MDTACYFIKDTAIFGSFPTQDSVHELERLGVTHFIDLTTDREQVDKVKPYVTMCKYIRFPIEDRYIPSDMYAYSILILNLCIVLDALKDDEKMYIHCRAGLGRSGVVVASILSYRFNMCPEMAIEQATKSLEHRKVLKDKWRKIGVPQTFYQKKFLYRFLHPLNVYKSYMNASTFGFSNYSPHTVTTSDGTMFPTAEAMCQSYKCPWDKDYVQQLLKSKSGYIARDIGEKMYPRIEIHNEYMEEVLRLKFDQHPEVKTNLLRTGLRPLVDHISVEGNILGTLLMKLRKEYYLSKTSFSTNVSHVV